MPEHPTPSPAGDPTVTVIIPAYNHELFVEEAISSVLTQTFQDFEIIITDDGSTDATVSRIRKFTDPRIRLFPFPENAGASVVVNFALQHAKGRFVALLNSDDVFLPDKLERQVQFLEQHENLAAIFGDAHLVDETGALIPDTAHYYGSIFKQPNRSRFAWLHHFFFKENCLCHPTILIRAECYRTLGGFNESYAQLPDFEFWIRFCLRYELHVSPEKFIRFRILSNDANASGRRPAVISRADWEHRHLLHWFLDIPPEDFCKVFPEHTGPAPQTRREVAFALAQVALAANVHHGFAIDVLYRLLQEGEGNETFRHRDLIHLTGKYGNVFLSRLGELEEEEKRLSSLVREQQAVLSEQQRQLEAQNQHLISKDQQIDALLQSTSWRITRPLRWLAKRLKNRAAQPEAAPSPFVPSNGPLLSILIPRAGGTPEAYRNTMQSLVRQTYSRWQLLVAGENHTSPQPSLIGEWAGKDERVKLLAFPDRGQLPDAVEGEFLLSLNPGEILADNALESLLRELDRSPEARIVYGDETIFDNKGNPVAHHLKPAWDPDLLYATPYLERGVLLSTALVRAAGGFAPEYGIAADYDLVLKCFEQVKPSQVRHVAAPLSSREGSPQTFPGGDAYERAVRASLARQGIAAEVLPGEVQGVLRLRYPLPEPAPLVSIVILTRDRLDLLERCVASILAKTEYPAFEIIIVDNGSQEPQTLDYLRALEENSKVRVLSDGRPFNFAALNNSAIRQASGQLIATLNNDMEVIGRHWLTEMVSQACRPGVGAVGARLWFPDDTLQHAGVVFVKGSALHAHRGLGRGQAGYWGRAVAVQHFSAVTAACLVVRKELYWKAGGMNEADLPVSYNDVDLCLKLAVAGYRTVWTPYAELYHYESASRGDDLSPEHRKRALAEYAYMVRRWGTIMERDPAWAPEINTFLAGALAAKGQKKG